MTARTEEGLYTEPFALARSLTLFAASAAGVPAIETVYPDFRDADGLAACAARARRDGFARMLAIHPIQVPIINTAFTPTDAEIHRARAIVALFDASPGAGVFEFEGRIIDAPHLKQARRVLSQV